MNIMLTIQLSDGKDDILYMYMYVYILINMYDTYEL